MAQVSQNRRRGRNCAGRRQSHHRYLKSSQFDTSGAWWGTMITTHHLPLSSHEAVSSLPTPAAMIRPEGRR